MTLELPLLRLGLAGFSSENARSIERMFAADNGGSSTVWEACDLDIAAADAFWINGARTQALTPDRIRVASGTPGGRSLQFHLPDVDRPIGFARPLPPGFDALCSFDLADGAAVSGVLRQFEAWLAPVTAQFCLASCIVEHQAALGSGRFELCLGKQLLAVVDMQGDVAVRATAGPADFEGGRWRRSEGTTVPENFAQISLAQLMWQYTMRTQRDVLPKHYRTGLLYFRRAPQVRQNLLRDSHLLVMRELMIAPATFETLQQRIGLGEERLARELAALYFVGSITSNPKRATAPHSRTGRDSGGVPSHLDSVVPSELPHPRRPQGTDLTVPAPLLRR